MTTKEVIKYMVLRALEELGVVMKIKIGPFIYPVFEHEELLDDDGDKLFGSIEAGEQKITLWKHATKQRKEQALIHEVLHGISCEYGIGLDEQQVHVLGLALYQLIKDNKEIVAEMAK